MEQAISVLRVVGWYFSFYTIFCKQKVETDHLVMQHLILVCIVCLCPTKRMLGLNVLLSTIGHTLKLIGFAISCYL